MTIPPGTRSDLESKVDIEKIHGGYMGSESVIQSFIDQGIRYIKHLLPHKVSYSDFGGGTGILTSKISQWLSNDNHEVEPTVIDANPGFLARAQERGLNTGLSDITSCQISPQDLITMRFVLHYNPYDAQVKILKKVYDSLAPRGVFVHQMNSCSDALCKLKTKMVNLPSLGRSKGGESFFWMNEQKYLTITDSIGFKDTELIGYAPALINQSDEYWNRFNSAACEEATRSGDKKRLEELLSAKKLFLKEATQLCIEHLQATGAQDITFTEGSPNIPTYAPIFVSKRGGR